jgi:outer membrane protein TolC
MGSICDIRFTIYVATVLALGAAPANAEPTNSPISVEAQGNVQVGSGEPTSYPIDLPTALRLAGAQNLDIQIARERLNEAQADRQTALEGFFPWVSAGVGYHRRDGVAQAVPAGTISDAHFQSYSPGAALSAQVALGDAFYKSLAAKQLVRASDQALEAQRQDSVLSAAQGYFELEKAKSLVEVVRQALKTSQDYQAQLHAAVASGIAFKGDELRVQSQSERYEISLRQALEHQRIAAADLARTLHLDARVDLVPPETELAPLTLFETNVTTGRLVDQALSSRPELKQSQSLVSAAQTEQKGTVYGPLIPSLGAQAYGGGLGGGPDGGPGNFGPVGDYSVGVSWRIGPGGLFDSGRIKGTKARVAAAQLSQEKLRDEVIAQVVTAVARSQSLSTQLELARRNLATASETLRLTRERKQYGVGIVLEDIQAQQDLTQARSDYFTSLAEYDKAQYTLSKAVGGLPAGASSQSR